VPEVELGFAFGGGNAPDQANRDITLIGLALLNKLSKAST